MKVLVPDFLEPLPRSTAQWQFLGYRPEDKLPQQHYDAAVLVLWGNNLKFLAADLPKLEQLQLLQTLSAGYDHLQRCWRQIELPDNLLFSCGVGLHNRRVAEYCLTAALYLCRQFGGHQRRQQQCFWPRFDARAWAKHGSLLDCRVTICGLGSIGMTLVKYLQPLTRRINGIGRREGQRHGVPTYTLSALGELLPATDLLINLLPGGSGTAGIFTGEIFARLPSGSYFINAGRGSSVNEPDLIAALTSGRLAGAALDVVGLEPLSECSPLWQAPNLLLTPHVASAQPENWQQLLLQNLERLQTGQPLLNAAALYDGSCS